MGTDQIAVRLPRPLLSDLDKVVASGAYESRAGIEAILALEEQRLADRAVIDGYTRMPPTPGEAQDAIASLREAILEEPW